MSTPSTTTAARREADRATDSDYALRVKAFYAEREHLKQIGQEKFENDQREHQQKLWDTSPYIVLARVIGEGRVKRPPTPYGTERRVTLRPVRWLKGAGWKHSFKIYDPGVSDCGSYGGGSAVGGQIDELFIAFYDAPDAYISHLLDSIGTKDARVNDLTEIFQHAQ